MRADLFIATKLNISRNKASQMIEWGLVLENGKKIKPSTMLLNDEKIEILDDIYVGRAAYKLLGLLSEYKLELKDKICLDIGSSTGGFAQVLLENQIKKIDCVDVGTNQLHPSLRLNPQINLYENMDIRDFSSQENYDFVFVDVSFISILDILKPILKFAKNHLIILFKPQFEVGKNAKRTKKGVVKDQKIIQKTIISFETLMIKEGFLVEYQNWSKLKGKEGNAEYFFVFKRR